MDHLLITSQKEVDMVEDSIIIKEVVDMVIIRVIEEEEVCIHKKVDHIHRTEMIGDKIMIKYMDQEIKTNKQ
jgi:hypothetical protein